MSRGKADYFLKFKAIPAPPQVGLYELDAACVPTVITAIEGVKAPSFWATAADAAYAYQALTKFQEGLLIDMSERIIRNIWAARGIPQDTAYDANFVPLAPVEGTTMYDLYYGTVPTIEDMSVKLTAANSLLTEIRDLLAAGASGADITGRLDTLILLLGGA